MFAELCTISGGDPAGAVFPNTIFEKAFLPSIFLYTPIFTPKIVAIFGESE